MLTCAYTFDKARVVVEEMADAISLELVEKRLVADQMVLNVGYDMDSLSNPAIRANYYGEITTDHYGRSVPKSAHGTANLPGLTSSAHIMSEAILALYDKIVNPNLLIRRLSISTNHVVRELAVDLVTQPMQLDLFSDYESQVAERNRKTQLLARERKMQEAIISIKKRYGKNAVLKGLNYADGATAKERNQQIGGHKA